MFSRTIIVAPPCMVAAGQKTIWHNMARGTMVDEKLRAACYALLSHAPATAGMSTLNGCFNALAACHTALQILGNLSDSEFANIGNQFGYSQWQVHERQDVALVTASRLEESRAWIYNAACVALHACVHLDSQERTRPVYRAVLHFALFAQRAFEFLHGFRIRSDPVAEKYVVVMQGGLAHVSSRASDFPFTNSDSLNVLATAAHAYSAEIQLEIQGDSADAAQVFHDWLYLGKCYDECYNLGNAALPQILSVPRNLCVRQLATRRRLARVQAFTFAMVSLSSAPGAHSQLVRAYRAAMTAIKDSRSSVNKNKPVLDSGAPKSLEDDPLQMMRSQLLRFLLDAETELADFFDGDPPSANAMSRDLDTFETEVAMDMPASTDSIIRYFFEEGAPDEHAECSGGFSWRPSHDLSDAKTHAAFVLQQVVHCQIVSVATAKTIGASLARVRAEFLGHSTPDEDDGRAVDYAGPADGRHLTSEYVLGRLYAWTMEIEKQVAPASAEGTAQLALRSIGLAYAMCAAHFFPNKRMTPRLLHEIGQLIYSNQRDAARTLLQNVESTKQKTETPAVSNTDMYKTMLRIERFVKASSIVRAAPDPKEAQQEAL